MVDELVQIAIVEQVQMLLQVSSGALGTRSDSHCLAVKEIGARTGLVDVWTLILKINNNKDMFWVLSLKYSHRIQQQVNQLHKDVYRIFEYKLASSNPTS